MVSYEMIKKMNDEIESLEDKIDDLERKKSSLHCFRICKTPNFQFQKMLANEAVKIFYLTDYTLLKNTTIFVG